MLTVMYVLYQWKFIQVIHSIAVKFEEEHKYIALL